MSAVVLVALVLLALIVFGFLLQVTFGLIGLIVTLFFAGLIGWVADQVIPGELPYGWIGAVVAGVLGGMVGGLLFGNMGPALFGIRPIPTFLGALIVVGAAEIATRSLGSGDRRRALQE